MGDAWRYRRGLRDQVGRVRLPRTCLILAGVLDPSTPALRSGAGFALTGLRASGQEALIGAVAIRPSRLTLFWCGPRSRDVSQDRSTVELDA